MGGDGMSVYLLFCVLWVSKGGGGVSKYRTFLSSDRF